jgi:hypothetical protein
MAARLKLPLYTVACHDDLTATDLVGRHLISDKATPYWCDGPLTRAVREGGICYLDEVVEARKDTTVVLHPLSDDRRDPAHRAYRRVRWKPRPTSCWSFPTTPVTRTSAQGHEAIDPPALRLDALRLPGHRSANNRS